MPIAVAHSRPNTVVWLLAVVALVAVTAACGEQTDVEAQQSPAGAQEPSEDAVASAADPATSPAEDGSEQQEAGATDGQGPWAPERPITIIVPAGPGGGSDQMTRQAVEVMEELDPRVQFVVENISGGGGAAGISEFLNRPADGYTYLQVHGDAMLVLVDGTVPATLDDFEMVGRMQAGPATILKRGEDDRFDTYDQMIEYMKSSGEPLISAIFIPEGFDDLTLRAIEDAEGVEFTRVPYVDAGERFTALLAGRADILLQRLGDLTQYIEGGEMEPVIVDLPSAPEQLPNVSTFDQEGLEFPVTYFRGFWAHADAPPEPLEYMRALVERAGTSEQWVSSEADRFYFEGYLGPEEWRERLEVVKDVYTEAYQAVAE